jgi:Cu/Ag efflux protein CusF
LLAGWPVCPFGCGLVALRIAGGIIMKRSLYLLTAIAALLTLAACTKKEEPKDQAKTYKGVGIVTAVDQENGEITINHEEIPGFMGAMTMRFPVKDKDILTGIQPNDKISFTITQTEREYFVSAIQVEL